MNKILFRYIFLELIPPIVLSMFLFAFILVSSQMLRATDLFAGTDLPARVIAEILLCGMPQLMLLTLPMACLLGVLMTYGRLAEQREIIAMFVGGVRYGQVLAPAIVFGFGLSVGLFFWADAMIPRAYHLRDAVAVRILHSLTSIGVQEGVFSERIPGLVFYVKHYDQQSSEVSGIALYQIKRKRVSQVILSPRGKAEFDPNTSTLSLNLSPGTIYQVPAEGRPIFSQYGNLRIEMNIGAMVEKYLGKRLRAHPGLSRSELRNELRRYAGPPRSHQKFKEWMEISAEYHRRAALPLACGLVALVAAPIGILMGRGKRAVLFLSSLAIILFYYMIQAGGLDLASRRVLSPATGIWLPNAILFMVGVGLNFWASRRR